jgi:hypothetical protein
VHPVFPVEIFFFGAVDSLCIFMQHARVFMHIG